MQVERLRRGTRKPPTRQISRGEIESAGSPNGSAAKAATIADPTDSPVRVRRVAGHEIPTKGHERGNARMFDCSNVRLKGRSGIRRSTLSSKRACRTSGHPNSGSTDQPTKCGPRSRDVLSL